MVRFIKSITADFFLLLLTQEHKYCSKSCILSFRIAYELFSPGFN